MRQELDDILCEKYPRLFQERNKSIYESCMGWGFDCGDGWFSLIDKLAEDIEAATAHLPEENRPIASQVKSKFGGLRFYIKFNIINDDATCKTLFELIKEAEAKSRKICEMCSAQHDSISCCFTLCEKCKEEKEIKEKNEP